MTTDDYQHHDELLDALKNAIWRLVRSKADLLDFFRGAGVDEAVLQPYRRLLSEDFERFKKPVVARQVLQDLNQDFDQHLRVRRELVRRVAQRDNFDACYPNARDEAELYVRRVREIVQQSDSFTRMHLEQEAARAELRQKRRDEHLEREKAEAKRNRLWQDLKNLSQYDDPHQCGRDFEKVLNDLFEQQGIQVLSSFKLVDDGVVTEQIDGVVLASGMNLLVEIKWHKKPLGNDSVGQHFMRMNQRANSHGLFIARRGFTQPAIAGITQTLAQHTTICGDWNEILYALEKNYSLKDWIQKKIAVAIGERKVYYRLGWDFQPAE